MRGALVAAIAMAIVVGACRSPPSGSDAADHDARRACGLAKPPCDEGAYCAYAPALCGKGKRPGVCTERPATCPADYGPVCGCDGKIYDDACKANAAGVDLSVTGGCGAKVPDWMPCGASYCNARASYCEIVLSDVFELPTTSTCRPLPSGCARTDGSPPSCDCFPPNTRCRSFCGPIETGGIPGIHLTCRS